MAVESIDIALKTKMPEFELPDAFGKMYRSRDLLGKAGLLVAFTCNHCPYAVAVWPRLVRLATFAKKSGINVVAINPNIHPEYPDDDPKVMKEKVKDWKVEFPYLVDESQKTAAAYRAQCTPDLYLLNNEGELVYHGRLDDNWKDETRVTKEELKEAMVNLVENKPIAEKQIQSIGCSIKWRKYPYD